MILGHSILHWLLLAIVAIIVFFIAQWLIPIIFGLVSVDIPHHIVNMLALLLAIGVLVGGWRSLP